MRVINKAKNIRKYYIISSFAIVVSNIILAVCVAHFFYLLARNHFSVLSFILAILCFSFDIYEAISICRRLLYVDQFTTYGNTSYVMMHAANLGMRKKLHEYAGLFINVKDFKYFNQRYGVDQGDILIGLYHKALTEYVKKHHGYAGRLGGDNYFVLIQKTQLQEFQDFLKNCFLTLDVDGEQVQVHVKARAGINEIEKDADFRSIIFHASIALTVSRELIQDFVKFQPYMLESFSRSKKLIGDSKIALKNNEFIPYYQPKVDIKNNRLCGAEALVRWKKDGKLIPPSEFVPALEKSGLIIDVDFRVFELVCQDIRNWIDNGITPVRVSTNFSKLHLKNPEFIQKIIEIKDKYDIPSKYLEVELTESSGITDFKIIQKFSEEITKAGMKVAIDDFGTGYSSLSMLQTVHVDIVKMDKSFLDNSFKDGLKQFVIDIIHIVKHQNEKVLFEGVEEPEQLEFLRENGCDYVQGFIFDRPLTHEDFEKRLLYPEYELK